MARTIRRLPFHHLRRPRTQAERRAFPVGEDVDIPVRAARNPNNLPDAWDDKPVAARKEAFIQ